MENLRIYPENYIKMLACSDMPYLAYKYAAINNELSIFNGNSSAVNALAMYKAANTGNTFAGNPFTMNNLSQYNYAVPENKPLNTPKGFLKTSEGKTLINVISVLPPLRRNASVADKIEQGNNLGAALQVGISLTNLPGDIREISRAGEEFKQLISKGVLPSAKNYMGQHEMAMLRGTFLEKVYNYAPALENMDKSLYQTGFGKFVRKNGNISIKNIKDMHIKGFDLPFLKTKSTIVDAYNFEGNFLQKLAGKSLLRTSVLGILTTGILEVPALYNSITKTKGSGYDKTKAFTAQLIKSAAYIGLVTAGISVAGAALGVTAIGSLVGMAIGSAVGISASKEINKIVDKIFKKPISAS